MIVPVSDIRKEARKIIEQTMEEFFTEGKDKVMSKKEAVNFLNRLDGKSPHPYIGRYFDPRENVFEDGNATSFTADYFVEHTVYLWDNQSQKKVS